MNLICGKYIPNPQTKTIDAWNQILKINYWPIFAVGRDILRQLPSALAAKILRTLAETTESVHSTGLKYAHDLTGHVFQRLIIDRKYLAAFYTLPASASLLARLAVAKMNGVEWKDANAIGRLRIADFACGTGALLAAVYDQITARHERTGGNADKLHPTMMQEVLHGFDVMPSAVHITSSTLSGAQPSIGYDKSRLYIMAYGRQKKNDSVKIGSLEFLQTDRQFTLINTTDPAKRTDSAGEETSTQILVEIPDQSLDMVIMNPPFTSNTKHYDADEGVQNAAFAAFESTPEEQDKMAARLIQFSKGTTYHGHTGLSSAFASLAHRKLKPGGVLSLVLPLTAINGSSWSKFRELIASQYTDITIVNIAANGKDMSLSSDTSIAECLVTARKTANNQSPSRRAQFISLNRRPPGFVGASELVKAMEASPKVHRLEDGTFGGIPLYCGKTREGESLDAPIDQYERGWGAARILDASVAQTAHALSNGKLWMPAEPKAHNLPIEKLNKVEQRGLDS